jgi:hypothetical protein
MRQCRQLILRTSNQFFLNHEQFEYLWSMEISRVPAWLISSSRWKSKTSKFFAHGDPSVVAVLNTSQGDLLHEFSYNHTPHPSLSHIFMAISCCWQNLKRRGNTWNAPKLTSCHLRHIAVTWGTVFSPDVLVPPEISLMHTRIAPPLQCLYLTRSGNSAGGDSGPLVTWWNLTVVTVTREMRNGSYAKELSLFFILRWQWCLLPMWSCSVITAAAVKWGPSWWW